MPEAQIISLNSRRFRLPGPKDRLAIIGRTGSGKTHYAVWALSHANWPTRPWLIIDYKRDELLRALPTEELKVDARRMPSRPGLYIVHPGPRDDDKVEQLLWRVWEKGRTGLYVDEGHILPDAGGLKAILTQGRSKSIPTIVLTQRPKWVNRFVFSEADYFALFHLNDKRDRITIGELMPEEAKEQLPRRWSWYYDIEQHGLFRMRPVPDRPTILETFARRDPNRAPARRIV